MIRFLMGALLTLQAPSAQIVTATNYVHQTGDNPDWARPLELLHAFHASALAQSSASPGESGWRRYASRIASYSRLRIASFTACRMNSARWRLAAGATLFRDFKSGSSSWINMDGIQL